MNTADWVNFGWGFFLAALAAFGAYRYTEGKNETRFSSMDVRFKTLEEQHSTMKEDLSKQISKLESENKSEFVRIREERRHEMDLMRSEHREDSHIVQRKIDDILRNQTDLFKLMANAKISSSA